MIYINTSAAPNMPDMMNPDNKAFIFNKDLDAQFLNELFDGDMAYAETVFGEFMKNLPDYWKEVEDAYNKQHIRELRTAVHKCKTLFGYVGSTDVQAYFQKIRAPVRPGTASAGNEGRICDHAAEERQRPCAYSKRIQPTQSVS